MSAIASVAVTIAKGSAKTYTCTHQTSGSDTTAKNITGWTIAVTIKRIPDGVVVLSKAGTVTNGAAGTYTWSVTAANTAITPDRYLVDIWRTDSGAETLMALGTFEITADVLH